MGESPKRSEKKSKEASASAAQPGATPNHDLTEKPLGNTEKLSRKVVLRGITAIAFDAYPGDNTTKLEVKQKLYLMDDLKTLCFPAENIMSFLSAENTMSAPKRLCGKGWKKIAQACLSFVSVTPGRIPFLRDGKPITVGTFVGDREPESGIVVKRHTARLKDGVPNPKERPFLSCPWSLEFQLDLYPNDEIKEATVKMLFQKGGIALGFGTFRGVFGKFIIESWS